MNRALLPRRRSAALFLALLAAAPPARAGECRIEATGADPSWQPALDSLAGAQLTDEDCASIVVEITPAGAHVMFVTRDGRGATRTIANPDELVPTIEALRVTGPTAKPQPEPEPEPEPDAKIESKRPPVVSKPAARETTPPKPRAEPTGEPQVMFALQAGARGGSGALVSPVLTGAASLALTRWEIGVMTALEFQYFDLRELAPGDHKPGAIALTASLGRREPLQSAVLLGGARLSLAALSVHGCTAPVAATDAPQGEKCFGWPAEFRLGVYLAAVLPRAASSRFRADLGADLALPLAAKPDSVAITPQAALIALVGVEF